MCSSHKVPVGSKILPNIPTSQSFHTSICLYSVPLFSIFELIPFSGKELHKYHLLHKINWHALWFGYKTRRFGEWHIKHKNTFSQGTTWDTAVPFPKQKHVLFPKPVLLLWLGRSFQNSSALFNLYNFHKIFSSSVNRPKHKLQKHRAGYSQRIRKSPNVNVQIHSTWWVCPQMSPLMLSQLQHQRNAVFWVSQCDHEPQYILHSFLRHQLWHLKIHEILSSCYCHDFQFFSFSGFFICFSAKGKYTPSKGSELDMEGFRNLNMAWGLVSRASWTLEADKVLIFLWPDLSVLLPIFILLLNG